MGWCSRYNKFLAICALGLIGYGSLAFYNSVSAEILWYSGTGTQCRVLNESPQTEYTNCNDETYTQTAGSPVSFGNLFTDWVNLTTDPEQVCLQLPYDGVPPVGTYFTIYLGNGSGSVNLYPPITRTANCVDVPALWTASYLNAHHAFYIRFNRPGGTTDFKLFADTRPFPILTLTTGSRALTITRPINGMSSTVPMHAIGNCNETTHLMVSDQPSYASSTISSFYDVTCSDWDWNADLFTATGNRMYLTATDTDEFVQKWWTPLTQQQISDEILSSATTTEILNWFTGFQIAKPFSYVTDIYDAIYQGLHYDYASSTYTLPIASFVGSATTSPYFHPTISLFDSTTLTNTLSQNQWSSVRTLINTILYIGFAFYIWRKVSSLL